MTPVELSRTVLCAVRRAVDEGELTVSLPARVVVERSRPGGCGDYATGVALQLARPAGRAPRQVAEVLRKRLLASPGVGEVDITGPGFLNITLDGGPHGVAVVRDILRSGRAYGYAHAAAGSVRGAGGADGSDGSYGVRLRVAPGVRAAVVADAVARILRSQGVRVGVVHEDAGGPERVCGVFAVDASLGLDEDGFDFDADGDVCGEASGEVSGNARGAVRASLATAESDEDVIIQPVPLQPVPIRIARPDWLRSLGCDAARWALLHPAAHDRVRMTEDHLVQRESNPLFLVRYAHARTRALVRNAADLGFTPAPGDLGPMADAATTLTITLAEYPTVLATAARRAAPDRLARHLVRTGDAFLRFQEAVSILPMGDEKPSAAHRARLALAEATGTVLAGGLTLLGIDAPDVL